jgi:hypothetical protein
MTWVSSRTTGLVIKSRCRDLVEAQVEDTGPGRETGKRKRGAADSCWRASYGRAPSLGWGSAESPPVNQRTLGRKGPQKREGRRRTMTLVSFREEEGRSVASLGAERIMSCYRRPSARRRELYVDYAEWRSGRRDGTDGDVNELISARVEKNDGFCP